MTDLTYILSVIALLSYGPVAFTALRREVTIRLKHYRN